MERAPSSRACEAATAIRWYMWPGLFDPVVESGIINAVSSTKKTDAAAAEGRKYAASDAVIVRRHAEALAVVEAVMLLAGSLGRTIGTVSRLRMLKRRSVPM